VFCRYCQNLCADDAQFCSKCGQSLRPAPLPVVPMQATPIIETNERIRAGEGCGFGMLIGIPFILIGGLLCLTVIGALIGIPMILVGFTSPLWLPFCRTKMLHGRCPYCTEEMQAEPTMKGITCPACKQRSLIRNGMFIRTDHLL
jgi:hypothetical protein